MKNFKKTAVTIRSRVGITATVSPNLQTVFILPHSN